MKIVIDNYEFNYDFGVKLLKAKYGDTPFEGLEDIWDDIVLPTFNEILNLENIEQRRVALNCFGIARLIDNLDAELVDRQTLTKKANYIDQNGELVCSEYLDTYELYRIDKSLLNPEKSTTTRGWNSEIDEVYFVKCKCTSTDRVYLIWVEPNSIKQTNRIKWGDEVELNAINAIAWTIQTRVAKGNIEKIIRQGDCVFIKPIDATKDDESRTRHLTEQEYRTLMVAES